MAEYDRPPKPHEQEAVAHEYAGERLGRVAEVLEFDPALVEGAKQELIEEVGEDGFDNNKPRHHELLIAYQELAEGIVSVTPDKRAPIGYQLALAQLWYELGDKGRFYNALGIGAYDDEGEEGVIGMLYNSGLFAELAEVLKIVSDLERVA